MLITCTTPQAAAAVLTILHTAQLHVRQDFTIQPVLSIKPPLIFTMLVVLRAALVRKIRAVPDTIVDE